MILGGGEQRNKNTDHREKTTNTGKRERRDGLGNKTRKIRGGRRARARNSCGRQEEWTP